MQRGLNGAWESQALACYEHLLFLSVVWWTILCGGSLESCMVLIQKPRTDETVRGVGSYLPGVEQSCGYTCKLVDGQ